MNNTQPEATIRVAVDPTNPGQFFACCGLLEVAHRLWTGTEGWFDGSWFAMLGTGSLSQLLSAARESRLVPLDPDTPTNSPLLLPDPIGLTLDWWNDVRAGGSILKTWAGQQKVVSIASAMQLALDPEVLDDNSLLNTSAILYDAKGRKVEPFYLDARRAAQSHNLDVGFSPDAQRLRTPVFSAVEFLCLVGLQRFRPVRNQDDNSFQYATWHQPLPIAVAAPAAAGSLVVPAIRFRFQLLYRTEYLKGFLPATRVSSLNGGSAQ